MATPHQIRQVFIWLNFSKTPLLFPIFLHSYIENQLNALIQWGINKQSKRDKLFVFIFIYSVIHNSVPYNESDSSNSLFADNLINSYYKFTKGHNAQSTLVSSILHLISEMKEPGLHKFIFSKILTDCLQCIIPVHLSNKDFDLLSHTAYHLF